jgi:hypothetical protein
MAVELAAMRLVRVLAPSPQEGASSNEAPQADEWGLHVRASAAAAGWRAACYRQPGLLPSIAASAQWVLPRRVWIQAPQRPTPGHLKLPRRCVSEVRALAAARAPVQSFVEEQW